jgi:hypothetical protein
MFFSQKKLLAFLMSFGANSTDAKAILYEMTERMGNTIEGNYNGTLFDDDDLTQLN